MSGYRGPVCRLCRREGVKLMSKGERCNTEKCSFERRAYAPGIHGKKRVTKSTDYGIQLREKQKVKRMYNVLEKQFRAYFAKAEAMKGVTGENLLLLLERRFDNMVYRMGFASSRKEARQLVRHDHFLVNNKKMNIPSYGLKLNDVVTIVEKSRNKSVIEKSMEQAEANGIPAWFELDKKAFSCTVVAFPSRNDITAPIKEQLIVELYSK